MKKTSSSRKTSTATPKRAAARAKVAAKATRKKSTKAAGARVTPTQRKATAKRKASTAGASRKGASGTRKAGARRKGGASTRAGAGRNKAQLEGRERIHAALEDFSSVMMVTMGGEGVRVRPMAVAELADDCTLTFLTSVDTAKVREAEREPKGCVVAQSTAVFLALQGTYEVIEDRARVDSLWSPADKIYFPAGKDDPNIRVMTFRPKDAEIWDVSGARGLTYLFEAAKALITGTRPDHERDQHDVVKLAQN